MNIELTINTVRVVVVCPFTLDAISIESLLRQMTSVISNVQADHETPFAAAEKPY